MSEKLNDDEIEKQINLLFETAEREKYLHSRAKETFDSIAGLWFLDNDIQSKLASIACNYIVSSFLLTALRFIYEQLRVDYDLPKISARDIGEDSVRNEFIQRVKEIMQDQESVHWVRNRLLPECMQLLNRIPAENLEDVSRLGNLADSIERTTEQYAVRENGELWVYDSVFRFSNQVLGASATSIQTSSGNIRQPLCAYYSDDIITGQSELVIAGQYEWTKVGQIGRNDIVTSHIDRTERHATNIIPILKVA